MGFLVLYMYMVLQFSNSFHKCCSSALQFKILKILLVQIILYLHYISFADVLTFNMSHTLLFTQEYYTWNTILANNSWVYAHADCMHGNEAKLQDHETCNQLYTPLKLFF